MGNRIKRILDGKEEIYHYNNKNQLLQIEKENDTIFYKYDNQGNTLEEKSGKGTKSYVYDLYNRVREITTETGDHIKNSYTPLGLRYKKEVNGVVSRYIVDDWNIIAEVDKENNIKSREVRGYELLKKEVENKDYFYHTNEHGDVTYLSNIAGEIENSYSYDVFGNIRKRKENIENIFKYAGEQLDEETEQYYLRARYYNPTIGRFTQEDVYRDDGLNLYVYVINNPLLWVDPSGYKKCKTLSVNNDTAEIDIKQFLPDKVPGPNGKDISKRYDELAYGGYYSRKEYNRMRYEAKPEFYDKHTKARTEEQARKMSCTGGKAAQYLPGINREKIEYLALLHGTPIKHSDSTTYFIYDAGKKIGYDGGEETRYMRSELKDRKFYHGHPMSRSRVEGYLRKVDMKDE